MKKFFAYGFLFIFLLSSCNPTFPNVTISASQPETIPPTSTMTVEPTKTTTRTKIPPGDAPANMRTAVYRTIWAKIGTPVPTITLTPSVTPEPNQTLINAYTICRKNVDLMSNLKKGLEFSEHFWENPLPQEGDFDVTRYFQVYPNIKLEDGYRIDYIFFGKNLNGSPVIYAVPITTPPFKTYEDYLTFYGEPELAGSGVEEFAYNAPPSSRNYLYHVSTDDSPSGYFQFLLVALQGDQFYLRWHANYNDKMVLCDHTDLEKVKASLEEFHLTFPEDVANRMKTLDLSPSVSIGQKAATVRIVQFTKWGGFYDTRYTFRRAFPHELLNVSKDTLIEYECNIDF